MIGIIGALAVEIQGLADELQDKKTITCNDMVFETGRLFGKEAVLAVCGAGKVNAAVYTDTMIHLAKPDFIINLGVAGALDSRLNIGDIVVADCCVEHDMDTSGVGDPVGHISGINMIEMPCDKDLVKQLMQAAKSIQSLSGYTGMIATGDQFISSPEQKAHILSRFNAMACEMEGGAIAHTCVMHGVPFAVVRSMSDKADGSAHMDFPQYVRLAAKISSALIKAFMQN